MIDEGYIKFLIEWERAPAPEEDLADLLAIRNALYDRQLIGYYEVHGVGYGNVSQRSATPGQFLVSGTQTGHIPKLLPEHFCRVTDWNIAGNQLWCKGPIKASSESLTHAALYDCDPTIQSILHIHHGPTWEALLKSHPATAPGVAYGTPEMAQEMARLYRESALPQLGVFAMTGHDEGVFAFGPNLASALERLDAVVVED